MWRARASAPSSKASCRNCPAKSRRGKDWKYHLGTIFPEVRLKQFIEMRGADMGDEKSVTALSAFWVGLLYDEVSLEAAWEMVKPWSREEREHDAPRSAAAGADDPA